MKFERGRDPKETMRIGRSLKNPFKNGILTKSHFKEVFFRNDGTPYLFTSKNHIILIKKAAKLLKTTENEIMMGTINDNYVPASKKNPQRTKGLKEIESLGLDEYESFGKIKNIDNYYLDLSVDGNVYIINKSYDGIEYILTT